MDKKVCVLTPHGRRQNVPVTPNTTLLQVLEEVCQKHQFDSDEYCLKHHNKEVSLSQMFRFSGLPNNCLLEMHKAAVKRVATQADVCIQLEDGSRKQGTFQPSHTLWHVLESLCAAESVAYENPVVIYTRQEIVGRDSLQKTTLKSLGILEGRTMMRFVNKNPEDLKKQANVYVPATVKDKPEDSESASSSRSRSGASAASSGGSGGFSLTKDLLKSLKKPTEAEASSTTEAEAPRTEPQAKEPEKPKYDWGSGAGRSVSGVAVVANAEEDTEEQPMEPEPEINIIGDREAILYSLDDAPRQPDELPDSFFDLTIHDLKLVLRDLRRVAKGTADTPLLTEKLRELEENKTMLNKIAKYKNCVIRVKFPDGHVLQGMFKPIEKLSDVVQFVKPFLQKPEVPFHLFTTPPKVLPELDKTLLELDFVPTTLLYFAFDNDLQEADYLKAEYLQKLTSLEGALYAAGKFRVASARSYADDENNNDDDDDDETDFAMLTPPEQPSSSTGAIPKRPRN